MPLEFPRVDERVVGRRHGIGWASGVRTVDGRTDFGGELVRIDGATGDARSIDLGPGRLSGEWVMVPRAPDSPEDDGWLLSLVYDRAEDRTDLVVLAAADPAGGAGRDGAAARHASRSASTATGCRRREPGVRAGRCGRASPSGSVQALAGTLASAAVAGACWTSDSSNVVVQQANSSSVPFGSLK